jgi:hypothetical protein
MDMTRVLPALFAAAVIALPATASAQWPSSPTVIIVNPSPAFGNYGGWSPDVAPGVAAAAWGGGCGADWDGGCGVGWGGGCGGGCVASWGWGGLGLAAGAVVGTVLAAAPYYGGYYGYGYPYYGSGYGYDSSYGGDGYGSGYGYPSYTAYGYSSPYDGHGYGYSPSYYRYASRPYSRYRHYYASARPVYRAHPANRR